MKFRITTGWLKKKNRKQKLSFMRTMVCLEQDCGHLWDASRLDCPCPRCGSRAVICADNWDFERKGMLKLGGIK